MSSTRPGNVLLHRAAFETNDNEFQEQLGRLSRCGGGVARSYINIGKGKLETIFLGAHFVLFCFFLLSSGW